MTKIVIPPPDQQFVTDGQPTDPWRRHFDVSNQHLNSATQLISVTPVTAASTGYVVQMPNEWRSHRLKVSQLFSSSTTATLGIEFSNDGGQTFSALYRYAIDIISDTTARSATASTGGDRLILAANVSTSSTGGGFNLNLELTAQFTRSVYTFNGGYMAALSTPEFFAFRGAGNVSHSDRINAVRFGTTVSAFTTGTILLYGDR